MRLRGPDSAGRPARESEPETTSKGTTKASDDDDRILLPGSEVIRGEASAVFAGGPAVQLTPQRVEIESRPIAGRHVVRALGHRRRSTSPVGAFGGAVSQRMLSTEW